jgi:two-component system, NtrC family, response regulator HydG
VEQTANVHILVVDDEEGIRFTISRLLRKEGYQVDVAGSQAESLICLRTVHYDLVFIDIMLIGESGITLLQEIKVLSPTTKIIMCTGYPDIGSAAAAVRLGAFDYITKPLRHETLLSTARHALDVKQRDDELGLYRANMDTILRTVSDSIIMVDKDGCLAHFNAPAAKICGYTSDLIGSNIAAINLGCKGVCRAALLETLSSNSPREMHRLECYTPEGKKRIVNFTATPVTDAEETSGGAVAVIRDETHLVNLENTLQKHGLSQGMIGVSAPMQQIYSLIETLADVQTTVLINGENGTGKELVAAALHASGCRAAKPFVKVNCAALSESLLESELFGHVRGAFTGAITDRVGRFQRAHGGTLFLDEIGDISPVIQMRLLRVLQEREFERVGDSTPITVDVRIIAATNQNLAEKISQGTFRQDLYYRLNVVRIQLPALRERLDDLEPLVMHFIAGYNSKFGKDICAVSDDVMALFRAHAWPGNVRELEHAIEHASIHCKTEVITVSDLPHEVVIAARSLLSTASTSNTPPNSPQNKLTIEEALVIAGGNRSRAAELMGISRRTLYRHIAEQ